MKLSNLILPAVALATAGALLLPAPSADAYTTIGGNLDHTKRHFRVFNNFTNANANSNQTPHPNFPGALGAVMAIWKGCVEWGTLHADGTGDPHQSTGLGSGNSNFEAFFAGQTTGIGGINGNIHSLVSGCGGGTLAYCETPISDGWRIRFCDNWSWHGGPQTNVSGVDIQGVAAHEYGHALGLGHSTSSGATMQASISGSGVSQRSIASDDIAGVQFIYGTVASTKPRITGLSLSGSTLTINGENFSATGNTVWFTQDSGANTNSPTLQVTNVPSSGSGTVIQVVVPGAARPGHVAVRRNATTLGSVSNPWPFDPAGGGCTPDVTNYCTTSPNSVGSGAIMGWAGSTNVSDANLTLTAYGCPPSQFGIFFYGPNEASIVFGNGIRCVGGGTFRFPPRQADFFGDIEYDVNFATAPAGSGSGQLTNGSTWKFQCWYRDPAAGGAGFNLSDGMSITFCP